MKPIRETSEEVKKDLESTITVKYLVGVSVGLAVLFATVYVVGKAWKKSQMTT